MTWPSNDVERALDAAARDPAAGPALLDALRAGELWVPLPSGGGPEDPGLDLPTMELIGPDGAPGTYVPVFSSAEQLRIGAGTMAHAVAPALEFARGLPPGLGLAVNPEGTVGAPLPPAAVSELCREHPERGGRVRLWEPDPQEEPVAFLRRAAERLDGVGLVLTGRRALASVEGDPPELFVGLELDRWLPEDRALAVEAVSAALAEVPVPWAVRTVLLDIAHDPVGDWMVEEVAPFYQRLPA